MAGSILGTAVGGAYVFSDPSARRSLDFWSRLGPVVVSYIGTHLLHKHLYKSSPEDRKAAFHELHEKCAPKVFDAIVDLRGIFVKAGQYLSVRPEITPEPYCRYFKTLQTNAPSEPLDVILAVIKNEIGRPVEEAFSYIAPEPCGSASTAQAHVAHLKGTHEEVVIKVQYPDAEAWFNSDISSLSQMARLINKMDDAVDQEELEPILKEFSKQFLNEFDYVAEQNNMVTIGNAIRANGKFDKSVVVPRVIESLCTPRIITMTYLPGPTLERRASVLLRRMGVNLRQGVDVFLKDKESNDKNGGKMGMGQGRPRGGYFGKLALQLFGPNIIFVLWGAVDAVVNIWRRTATFLVLDVLKISPAPTIPEAWGSWALRTRRELDELGALSHIHQWLDVLLDVHGFEVFGVGIFNGDPHPGNILVLEDDRLGLIDYGQVKILSADSQLRLAKLVCLVADETAPDALLADAFREVGVVTLNDSTEFIATFARLMLGRLKAEHMDTEWHLRLHEMDRMTQFPPDMMIMVRMAMLLRGMALLLKQNVSVAECWRKEAEACIARGREKGILN